MAQSARDVAAMIIEKKPGLTQMQLHKHLYFVQAASLTWFDEPAFDDRIVAMEHGPVVPEVHYGEYGASPINEAKYGDSSLVDERRAYVIDKVIADLDGLSAAKLRKLTHDLPTWKDAWGPDSPSYTISHKDMLLHHGKYGASRDRKPTAEQKALAERIANGDQSAITELLG